MAGCNWDPNKDLYDDCWDVSIISIGEASSYEYMGNFGTETETPDPGNIFKVITVSVRNKDTVYHGFGGDWGESSSLHLNSAAAPIYEDKGKKQFFENPTNIPGGGSATFTWYYEVPIGADLANAYLSVYGPSTMRVNVPLK